MSIRGALRQGFYGILGLLSGKEREKTILPNLNNFYQHSSDTGAVDCFSVQDDANDETAEDFVYRNIEMFPHCDQRVLHAPGSCAVCDACPVLQAARLAWNIAFSGAKLQKDQLPDPAEFARGDSWFAWAGNRPMKPKPCCDQDDDGDGNCDVHSSAGVFRNPAFRGRR